MTERSATKAERRGGWGGIIFIIWLSTSYAAREGSGTAVSSGLFGGTSAPPANKPLIGDHDYREL